MATLVLLCVLYPKKSFHNCNILYVFKKTSYVKWRHMSITFCKLWAKVTSWKLCWVNLSAIRSSSRQECVSAKALMPRQLEGSSCLLRNSQQASWISASWRRQAAGRSVCTFPSSTVTWEQGGRTLEAYTCIITKLKMTQVYEKCTIFWKWLWLFFF